MSDQKISQLTSITGANTADDDVLVIVDTSASQTKKITLGELENALAERDFSFGDNDKLTFGNSSDLQIYHDGSNSYIDEVGAGSLRVRGYNQVRITDTSDNIAAIFKGDAESTLYHNNSPKFATTSTGIDISGTVTADGLTVDGSASIELTSVGATTTPLTLFNDGAATSDLDYAAQIWISGTNATTRGSFIRSTKVNTSNAQHLTFGVSGNSEAPTELMTLRGDNRKVTINSGTGSFNANETLTIHSDSSASTGLDASVGSDAFYMLRSGGSQKWSFLMDASISNALRIYDYTQASDRIRINANGDMRFNSPAGSEIIVNGESRDSIFRVHSTTSSNGLVYDPDADGGRGLLSLNTSAPTGNLFIERDADFALIIATDDNTSGLPYYISLGASSSYEGGILRAGSGSAQNNSSLFFETSDAGTEAIRGTIRYDGNWGVGTTAPEYLFTVSSSTRDTGGTIAIENRAESGSWTSGDVIGTLNFAIRDTSSAQKIRGQIQSVSAGGTTYPTQSDLAFRVAYSTTLREPMRLQALNGSLHFYPDATYPTAIRVTGGASNDITLLRTAVDGDEDDGDNGFSIKYMGSRSGNDNSLSIFSDNQSAGTQVEAFRMQQTGQVTLNAGLTFGSVTNDALHNYDVGTWTPTVTTVYGNVPSGWSAATDATYVRIGDQVTVTAQLNNSTANNVQLGDRLAIDGLPFTQRETNEQRAAGTIFVYGTLSSGDNAMGHAITTGTTAAWVYISFVDGSVQWNDTVTFTLTYFTDDS